MSLITLDFETYYDQKTFSLSKMTTESYIRDKQFEVIGVGVKVDDAPATWFSGSHEKIKEHLDGYDWANANLVCHHTAFDGAILKWIFDIEPKYYFDTLSMARPLHGLTVGGSLAAMAKHYGLPAKGTEVVAASGKRRKDFDMTELWNYGNYCKNDVEITYMLFNILKKETPQKEMYIIDMMLRMFIDPVLTLDKPLLQEHLSLVRQKKADLMDTCFALDDETLSDAVADRIAGQSKEAIFKEMLMSNPKFAKLLESFGVEPPMKVSLRTGKEAYAFGKTDVEFKKLLDHENEQVQALVSARMGIKSTLEETRTESFIAISDRGTLPIMLNYYGAHTGRASGGDKINLQNLPRGGSLRKSIKAPTGHSMVASDSSQIEARVVAWLAGETDLLGAFAGGRDIYSEFATDVYGKNVTKADKVERFVGKTCIAHDSLVLTDKGLVPIQDITLDHKLWDGVEWVKHDGLIYQGEKNVITYQGLTATEDHGVFTEYGAIPFGLAASRLADITTTGVDGEAIRVSKDYFEGNTTPEEEHLCVSALYKLWCREMDFKGQPSTGYNSWVSELQSDEVKALKSVGETVRRNNIKVQPQLESNVQTLREERNQMPIQVSDGVHSVGREKSSSQGLQENRGRQNRQQRELRTGKSTTSYEDYAAQKSEEYGYDFLEGGEYTNGGVSVSLHPVLDTQVSNEAWFNWRADTRKVQVYDILNAGKRRRFTVNGKLVFNCILGLGYGMGKDKFKSALKIGMGGISVDVDIDEAERVVNLYRSKYANIAALWKEGQKALDAIFNGFEFELGTAKLKCDKEGIHLPNGMKVIYPELRKSDDGNYEYKNRYGFTKIYGGKLIENVVQALARIVVFDQMAKIDQKLRAVDTPQHRFKVALTVHDEVVAVVPDKAAEKVKAMMVRIMAEAPSWCQDLPVACEADIGKSYADAK